MVKHKLTLSVDSEIVKQAKEFNINISTFLEVKLVEYLANREICGRRDSNPSRGLGRP
jgi:post-segregation antitoxin (ccd killing protein)